jgi:hypothetical protein
MNKLELVNAKAIWYFFCSTGETRRGKMDIKAYDEHSLTKHTRLSRFPWQLFQKNKKTKHFEKNNQKKKRRVPLKKKKLKPKPRIQNLKTSN